MRQTKRPTFSPARPYVGIVVDAISRYGRSVMRGAIQYANLQRKWRIVKDLRGFDHAESRSMEWPKVSKGTKLDGAIIAGLLRGTADDILRRCRHVVICSGSADPSLTPIVALDDEAAGAQAAEHLYNCRLESFSFYGQNPLSKLDHRRLKGFRDKLATYGLKVSPCPLESASANGSTLFASRPKLVEWLRSVPKPIGILGRDDYFADDLADACFEADIGVPDHVAILGINNDDLLCESAWPPLSSIEVDYSRMGYRAAQVLERLLAGETLAPDDRFIQLPPLGVARRQSTDILAVKNTEVADAVRFIRENACNRCTVSDVLRAVPVGRRWLERHFVEQLGHTPHDEMMLVRINAAKQLLGKSNMTIEAVAERCGFAGLNTFYSAFTKAVGTAPARYRRAVIYGPSINKIASGPADSHT
ncbi:MAG: substrate-binding domain-containing protein [Burkholderiales bacterium]|nr:substrate-binding domain-containing protein [Phycisphaerae bacterium]